MSEQSNDLEPDQLDRVAGELMRSLSLCRSMVNDYRSKLAANSNEPATAGESEQADDGGLG